MKFTIKTVLLIFAISTIIQANVIVEFAINELYVNPSDPYDWQIELTPNFHPDENAYIKSNSDSAFFKSGLTWAEYKVITNDSLQNPVAIRRLGDLVQIFYEQSSYPIDELAFGDIENPMVSVPISYSSISLHEYRSGEQQHFFLYLDKSPTLAKQNDTTNARGTLIAFVKDEYGTFLSNVEVSSRFEPIHYMQYFVEYHGKTDNNGLLRIKNYARLATYNFSKDRYHDLDIIRQIWPERTDTLNIVMKSISGFNESPVTLHPQTYRLNQNYPNPFNNLTKITYTLPLSDFVELTIYNLNGQKVQTLVNEYQNYGEHEVNWTATGLPSGLYIYRLQTSETTITKKCILLK